MSIQQHFRRFADQVSKRGRRSPKSSATRRRRTLAEHLENRMLLAASVAPPSLDGPASKGPETPVVFAPPAVVIDTASLNPASGIVYSGADAGDEAGFSVDILGDVNGDGFDDLLIGVPSGKGIGNAGGNNGEAYIVFGGANLPSLNDFRTLGTADISIFGDGVRDELGNSVKGIGDFNGDGIDDFAIGAEQSYGPGFTIQNGRTYIFFGDPNLPATIDLRQPDSADVVLIGEAAGDHSGFHVSGKGDINGDGLSDMLIGAPDTNGSADAVPAAGEAYIVYGTTTPPDEIDLGALGSDGVTLFGKETQDHAGYSIEYAGDVNGDGLGDVLVGAPSADGLNNAKSEVGTSYLLFGDASLPNSLELDDIGTLGVIIHGVAAGDMSGRQLHTVGDVNGDEFDDFVIGVQGAGGGTAGESYVMFGKAAWPVAIDLAVGVPDGFTIVGAAGGQSGIVSGGGDVNGDGLDDIVISSPSATYTPASRNNAGETVVLFGQTSFPATVNLDTLATDGSVAAFVYGAEANDRLGADHSILGDVNGDGYDDLIVSSIDADGVGNTRTDAGEIYLIYGGDFSGRVTSEGGVNAETLTGTAGVDIMVGGADDDVLVGNGGADVLRGGEGDDILQVPDLGFERVVGGNGRDTLAVLGTAGVLDLRTTADNRILGIEVIDLTDNLVQTLRLDVLDVLNISDETNTLAITHDPADIFDIGAGWTRTGEQIIGFDAFEVFTQGNARLLIEYFPFFVTGTVFEDMDAAGDEDFGVDPGLRGVELEYFRDGGDGNFGSDGNGLGAGTGLGGDDDELVSVLLSADDGRYVTPPAAEGTYFLRRTLPDRHVETTMGFQTIIGSAGATISGIDFGSAAPGSIHGFKFEDIDGDGAYNDLVDIPMSGVEFVLTGTDGQGNGVNANVFSDGAGNFSFINLLPSVAGESPGTGYTLTEIVPPAQGTTTPTSVLVDLMSDQALVASPGQASLPVLQLPSLDETFGIDGSFIHPSDRTNLRTVALQSDGKIVAAGRADFGATAAGFRVTRLNADGTPDTTFGTGGDVVMEVVDPDDRALTVAVQPDGKILVGGRQGTGNFGFITRLNSDGSLDTGFATGGTLLLSDPTDNHVVEHLLVQPDGKIVFSVDNRGDVVIGRLNTNGTFDNGFGTNGFASVDVGEPTSTSPAWLALQPDGKVVGVRRFSGGPEVIVVRVTANGVPDPGFGFSGVNTAFLPGDLVTGGGVVVQPDGMILVAASNGMTNPNDNSVFPNAAVLRIMPAGGLDSTFGNAGVFVSDYFATEFFFGPTLGLLSSGNVVLGLSRGSDSGVLTLDSSGNLLDRSIQLYPTSVSNQLLVQPDDGLIVTGNRDVVRYAPQRVLGDEITVGGVLQFGNVRSDFGDAPDSYDTTFGAGGAQHLLLGPTLGTARDGEPDAELPLNGLGDGFDEDGVTISTLTADQTANIPVEIQNGPALLNAWIDFDRDGQFSLSEAIATDLSLPDGVTSLSFTVPPDAGNGASFARFRVSSAGGLGPSGFAGDGEVEDYAINLIGDVAPPQPVITGPASPSNLEPFAIDIDFGEEVIGFTTTDISINGGTIISLVDNGVGSFTAMVDAPGDGDITVFVPGNVAFDRSGKPNLASNLYLMTIDTAPPTPVINGPVLPVLPDFFDVTIDFGEAAILQSTDVMVTNGSVSVLTDLGGGLYRATIDAVADGAVTVQLPAAAASDLAGNPNFASNVYSATVDAVPPTPTITGPASPITSRDFDVTVTFDQLVTGFDASDITVIGGSVTNLVDTGGGVYTASISATVDATLSIVIFGDLAIDAGGNGNLPSNVFEIRVDTQAPLPVITTATNPTNQDPFLAMINFGEPVSGFDLTDLFVAGGTPSNLIDNGNGTFTVTVDAAAANGDVTLRVPAGSANDLASLPNVDSGFTVVTVDTMVPMPVIVDPSFSVTASRTVDLTVQFGETVVGFGLPDVAVGGGSVTSITAQPTAGEFIIRVVAAADGPLTVNIPAGTVVDTAGNPNVASNVISILVDTLPPLPVLSVAGPDPQANPFVVTVDFGEFVTGFASSDLVVTGGTAGMLTNVDSQVYTVEITAAADGPVRVELPAATVADIADNDNLAATPLDVVVDTLLPVPVITGPAGPTNDDFIDVTINFSEPVVDFEAADVTVGNGTLSGFVALSPEQYTVRITTAGDGPLTVDVLAGVAQDLFGKDNVAAIQYAIEIDKTRQIPVITGPASPSNQDPFDVTIDFGSPVNFFIPEDIIVFGGVVTNLVDDGGGVYTATVDADADRRVIVLLNANIAADLAGNTTLGSNAFQIVIDTTSPQPVITGPASFTNNDPFDIVIDFGEPVTDFVMSDLVVTNAVVSALTDNGNGTFVATLTAADQGLVTVDINADVASDLAGNLNLASSTFSVVIDTAGLVPFITGPAGPAAVDSFDITINFGELVNGFVLGDLIVDGGIPRDFLNPSPGVYQATVDVSRDGLITVNIPAATASDLAGNLNLAATQFATVIDRIAPTPVITGPPNPTNSDPMTVSIDFGEPVTGFTAADVIVGGGSVTGFVDLLDGAYLATIDAVADGIVTVDVGGGVANDAAGNANLAATRFTTLVDTGIPAPTIAGPSGLINQSVFTLAIDFGETVGGFTVGDLVVGNGTVRSLVNAGNGQYTATVESTVDGLVSVALPAGSAADAAGNSNLAATLFSVNVDTAAPFVQLTTGQSQTNQDPFVVSVDFGESVMGFIAGDFLVAGGVVSSLTDLGGGQYEAMIDANNDGGVTVALAPGVALDLAGNASRGSRTLSVLVDTTAPAPILTAPASPTNQDPVSVVIDFGEDVTGFVANDVLVTGGLVTGISDRGNGRYVVLIDADADGPVTIGVNANEVTDVAGNGNAAAATLSLVVDTAGPIVTLGGPVSPSNVGTFDVSIDFGQVVNDFTVSDVAVAGGTVASLVDNGGGSYVATIVADGDGDVAIGIPPGAVLDDAGNGNEAPTPLVIAVDTVTPVPILQTALNPINQTSIDLLISFGETMVGFDASDLSVQGGVVDSLTDNGNGLYAATLTASGEGQVVVSIPDSAAVDTAGNPNGASLNLPINVDLTAPIPIISAPGTHLDALLFDATVDFGESVIGFDPSDLMVSGGTLISLLDNFDGTYTATINAAFDGTVSLGVQAGAVVDLAGNPNDAATAIGVVVDTVTPTVLISTPIALTNQSQLTLTAVFSEPVLGLTESDFTIVGGTVGQVIDQGGNSYSIVIDALGDGVVTTTLTSASVTDLAGNPNRTSDSVTVVVDQLAPVPSLSGPVAPINTTSFGVTIDFGEFVSGIDASNVMVDRGTISGLTDLGSGRYTLTIEGQEGLVTVNVPANQTQDAAGNLNVAATPLQVLIDTSTSTPQITGPQVPLDTPDFDVMIDFGEQVSGFSETDVLVVGGSVVGSLVDNNDGTFTASIRADAEGTVTVSVPSGIAMDSAGNLNVASQPYNVVVDLTGPRPMISGPFGLIPDASFIVSVDFGETVTGFNQNDVSVSGGGAMVSQVADLGGGRFDVTVATTFDDQVVVGIPADVASDLAGNASLAAASSLTFDVAADLDFGDAPSALQSGFASNYPVLVAEDGARHSRSSLLLGGNIDTERDGVPTAVADGDGVDEDGIGLVTSLVVATTNTTSSLSIVASDAGFLNGWIDFNADGDWDDAGEHVFDDLAVAPGRNLRSFVVPSNASTTQTAARFRLNAVGGLSPTGLAAGGEVEDYWVTLVSGDPAAEVTIDLVGSTLLVSREADEIVIREGQAERLRVPVASINGLQVNGTTLDDIIVVDGRGGDPVPAGGLSVSGGAGNNTLRFFGADGSIDLASAQFDIDDVNTIDVSGINANTVIIDAATIAQMSPASNRVRVLTGEGDRVVINNASDWRLTSPMLDNGRLFLRAQHQNGSGESIDVETSNGWNNVLNASDVNNDGMVSALDALVIVNELKDRDYSDTNGRSVDPAGVVVWPGEYYDQNDDGRFSSLDALGVINVMRALRNPPPGGEGELVETPTFAPAVRVETRGSESFDRKTESEFATEISGKTVDLEFVTAASQASTRAAAADLALQIDSVESPSEIGVDELLSDEGFLEFGLAE